MKQTNFRNIGLLFLLILINLQMYPVIARENVRLSRSVIEQANDKLVKREDLFAVISTKYQKLNPRNLIGTHHLQTQLTSGEIFDDIYIDITEVPRSGTPQSGLFVFDAIDANTGEVYESSKLGLYYKDRLIFTRDKADGDSLFFLQQNIHGYLSGVALSSSDYDCELVGLNPTAFTCSAAETISTVIQAIMVPL